MTAARLLLAWSREKVWSSGKTRASARMPRKKFQPASARCGMCESGGRGDAQRRGFFRKVLLQPPFGDFDAGGEPHAFVALHVFDHFLERAGSAEPARHVRMELEGREHRRLRRFGVEIVKEALP